MATRANPKNKMREEEEELDRSLQEAGLLEGGMDIEEKKQLLIFLNESKKTAEKEMEMRRQSTASTTNEQVESEEEENDVVEMECDNTNTTKKQRMESPDIFEDSQDDQKPLVTSPFGPTEAVHYSSVLDGEDGESKGSDDIFHSGSDEEILKSNEEIENIAPDHKEQQNADSYQSANEVLETEEQDDDSIIEISDTNFLTSRDAGYLHKSALRLNILKCDVIDETEPFYKKFLAERPRNTCKQIPLYYDKSLKLTPEQHCKAVDAQLLRDSAMHARMLEKKNHNKYTEKWAAPIREGYDKDITSLDKPKPYQEPPECITLPWGAKPIVLNYQYNPKKSIRDGFLKLANRTGLSISRIIQSNVASTSGSSSGNPPKTEASNTYLSVQLEKLTSKQMENMSSAKIEPETTNRPKRENAGARKADLFVYEGGDDDDDDWLIASKQGTNQKGKGKGRARGRGRGGANQGAKKKGRGRQNNDSRQAPALVGVQGPIIQSRSGSSASLNATQISQELVHPALEDATQETECPICHHSFHWDIIENHAANCGVQDPSSECCPVCNTIVPESLQEKHRAKCGVNRRPSHSSASTSFISAETEEIEIEDLISEDDEPPPTKRSRTDSKQES